jgi:ribosome modulation factor
MMHYDERLKHKDFEDYLTYRNLLGMDDAVEAARQANERAASEASVRAAAKGPMATPESLAQANQEGLDAGLAGRNREANPYGEGSPENLKWDSGWVGGQRQNVARMAGSTEGAPARAG